MVYSSYFIVLFIVLSDEFLLLGIFDGAIGI